MSTTFESLMKLEGPEARRILDNIHTQGASPVMAELLRECNPGTGTLITMRRKPWEIAECVHEDGDYVMYYDTTNPSVGIACVVDLALLPA